MNAQTQTSALADPTAALAALPTLAAGVTCNVLRRVWFATPADQRLQRTSLFESSVYVPSRKAHVKLVDLTVAEIEAAIGAITPTHVVRFFDPEASRKRLNSIRVVTFVNEQDAIRFAEGKTLYGRPAQAKSIRSVS